MRQDAVIIGGSIVFAAVLLLLYAYTVPYYWMASVARWFKGLGIAAVAFSGAAIVFAGAWLVDVQRWAAAGGDGQLAHVLDPDLVGDKAQALADYRADDLVALVKAFVLPYTVGVFVANAVVAYRKAKAKRESDAILDGFALAGSVDEAALPELEKRYLFFGGRRMGGHRPALHRRRRAPARPLRAAQTHLEGTPDGRRAGGIEAPSRPRATRRKSPGRVRGFGPSSPDASGKPALG